MKRKAKPLSDGDLVAVLEMRALEKERGDGRSERCSMHRRAGAKDAALVTVCCAVWHRSSGPHAAAEHRAQSFAVEADRLLHA